MTEAQYVKFLREVYLKKDGSHLDEASIGKYSKQTTRKIDHYIGLVVPQMGYQTIYDVQTIDELRQIQKALETNEDFRKENKDGHNMYSAGLNRYIEFAEGILFSRFNASPAILDMMEPIPERYQTKYGNQYRRDPIKVAQAKGACNYNCQINSDHETFQASFDGRNFVEAHHIIPLSCQTEFTYSLDVLANIIVLCPNCHRLMHYAIKPTRTDKLYQIYDSRFERFKNTGILVDRKVFVEMAMKTSQF